MTRHPTQSTGPPVNYLSGIFEHFVKQKIGGAFFADALLRLTVQLTQISLRFPDVASSMFWA